MDKIDNHFYDIHSQADDKEREVYRKQIEHVFKQFKDKMEISPEQIISDNSILEVGCGGRAASLTFLSSYNPKDIKAIDLNLDNLYNSQNICESKGIKYISFEEADALDLPFEDKSFDLVFSSGVIHHTNNPKQCFDEMCRVTKDHGYICLGIYGYGGIFRYIVSPLIRFMGIIIPYNLTKWFVNKTGVFRTQEYSLLDLMYTPIQKTYSRKKISKWFNQNGFHSENLFSDKKIYNMGILSKILFGDGYIYQIGVKIWEKDKK